MNDDTIILLKLVLLFDYLVQIITLSSIIISSVHAAFEDNCAKNMDTMPPKTRNLVHFIAM